MVKDFVSVLLGYHPSNNFLPIIAKISKITPRFLHLIGHEDNSSKSKSKKSPLNKTKELKQITTQEDPGESNEDWIIIDDEIEEVPVKKTKPDSPIPMVLVSDDEIRHSSPLVNSRASISKQRFLAVGELQKMVSKLTAFKSEAEVLGLIALVKKGREKLKQPVLSDRHVKRIHQNLRKLSVIIYGYIKLGKGKEYINTLNSFIAYLKKSDASKVEHNVHDKIVQILTSIQFPTLDEIDTILSLACGHFQGSLKSKFNKPKKNPKAPKSQRQKNSPYPAWKSVKVNNKSPKSRDIKSRLEFK